MQEQQNGTKNTAYWKLTGNLLKAFLWGSLSQNKFKLKRETNKKKKWRQSQRDVTKMVNEAFPVFKDLVKQAVDPSSELS